MEKDALFYARSGGGMTLSGGEPLMHADIALPLLREARHRRIKTAIETCGCIPWDTLKEAAPYLNYVLFDVKQMDSEKHREGVGVGNELILSNLKKLLTEFPSASSSRATRTWVTKPCPTTAWEPRSTTS